MKILVTGANGYIGTKVVKKLCEMNIEVIAADILSNNIDQRAKIYNVDILSDNKNWFEYFNKPDVCLHLAWRDGFIHNSYTHQEDLEHHKRFLFNLIDNGLPQVACMGTMHEIGYYEGKVDENTSCNPTSLYGKAKKELRLDLENYCKNNGCVFQWLRAFYIYGDDLYGNSVFCKLKKNAKEGKENFPFTSGVNKFDFIKDEELAFQISLAVIQKEITGIINCASGIPVSLGAQVEKYIKENELRIKLQYGVFPERENESKCIYADVHKINIIKEKYYNKKNILVTGADGQLGFDCLRELGRRGYEKFIGIDKKDLDITKKEDVIRFFEKYKPEVVIHNAAWTMVDYAEKNKKECFEVNALGTKNIAEACKMINAEMIYISTDYVFDGKGDHFFEINDKKNGLSTYGKSKSEGEDYVMSILKNYYIVRISWAFGVNGDNFIKKMINLSEKGIKELNVVDDQIGSPTYTRDLVKLLCDILISHRYGIYHATNSGLCSWAELAEYIFKEIKSDIIVNKISTDEYMKFVSNQATRPLNSRLSKKSLLENGFYLLPEWKDAVSRYIHEELNK